MNLSFLNPWFWLGALALAAPIWLHLRRRQEKHVVLFSALRFLEDQPEPQRSPLRLRDVLLFALRALALLALVGAFAWPYLRSAETVILRESRVYVLDNTLSHQAGEGFTRARDRILEELAEAGSDIQMAVVELRAQPRTVVSFGDDRAAARQKVRQLQPSFQRGSYLAAFRLAHSLLANSLGERKRIVFLGDNQENQWSENVNTPPFLYQVDVDLPKAPASALPNLSLAEPRLQRIFLGDKSLVNFTVKLTHAGDAKTATVTLSANEQSIFARTVDLAEQPGTMMLRAQWEADPSLWIRGEVALEGAPDALAADNRAFFALAPLVEGKVALLAHSPYLRTALSPDVMRGQWAAEVLDPAQLGAARPANQDADVLCIESNYLQGSEARKLVWAYLTNGRGVVLLIDRLTPAVTAFLREIGFEAESFAQSGQAPPEKLQFAAANHPIFHPFISPDFGNLLEVEVKKYARVKTTEAIPLMFSEKGAPLLFQSTRTHGRLFVIAFGLDRDHTSWPVHPTFIPFLDLTLQAARAEDPTPPNFEPGDSELIQLPPGSAVRQVVLRDDKQELARVPVEAAVARLQLPDKPGVFTLTYDDHSQIEKAFSVNPSPKESQLSYVNDPEALRNWRYGGTAAKAKEAKAGRGPSLSRSAVLQQRWWWWMLLASLTALALETVVAGLKRQLV